MDDDPVHIHKLSKSYLYKVFTVYQMLGLSFLLTTLILRLQENLWKKRQFIDGSGSFHSGLKQQNGTDW